MTTQDAPLTAPRIGDRFNGWLAPQVLLAVAFVLSFVFVLIHLNTVYAGLPAHPLLVHVPVILIPTVGVAALVLVYRQAWFERYSLLLCAVSLVALATLDPTCGVRTGRVIVGLLALGYLYFVFLTGDLGARAVWQSRIAAAQHAHTGG